MNLTPPYPAELLQVARKVVWHDSPEETLSNPMTFLPHLMVYGSSADLAIAEQYVPVEEFRKVLENAPAGVFTHEAWEKCMDGLECPRPLCHGAGFQMVRLVRRRDISLTASYVEEGGKRL